MALTKQERKRLAARVRRERAEARIDQCVLATGSLGSAKTFRPPTHDSRGRELGNWSLEIRPGESMVIFDPLLLGYPNRLDKKEAVVMDDFGGDFHAECFEQEQSLLVIPIGHSRQNLWPTTNCLKTSFSLETDSGSLAFLRSSQVDESLLSDETVWSCLPGVYNFYFEEIAELRFQSQALARNIVVSRSPVLERTTQKETQTGARLWSRLMRGLGLIGAERRQSS